MSLTSNTACRGRGRNSARCARMPWCSLCELCDLRGRGRDKVEDGGSVEDVAVDREEGPGTGLLGVVARDG